MFCKKTNLMALCEELATPVTQDGEFLLKGGFGSYAVSGPPLSVNGTCTNQKCINDPCPNGVCMNVECINAECGNEPSTTAKPDPTPELSEKPTKGSNSYISCGFLF